MRVSPYFLLITALYRSSGIEVDCYGRNVDRLLFNPAGGSAHYAFISGRAETDGTFRLFAGAAHGVEKGTTYAIYTNHVQTDQKCIGHLNVEDTTSTINAITTELSPRPLDVSFNLPPIFFAVETRCPHQTVDIFPGDVDTSAIKSSIWRETEEDKANITLKRIGDNIQFLWNGFADPGMRLTTGDADNLSIPHNQQAELSRAIRHAARFTYYVRPSRRPSSSLFEVEFQEVDENTEDPTGKDLLQDGLVSLDITKNNSRRSFCLVLRNTANFDIWPYVFRCDPSRFSIRASL
jgi:hypothetical protein